MFVFSVVNKVISNPVAAHATVKSGKQSVTKKMQQIHTATKAKISVNSLKKTDSKSRLVKNHLKKEALQKKTYTEEPVIKDSNWNIYTGNPGYYVAPGDTVNFGTVTTLSDSTFLLAQRTVIPKTIKPYGFVGKELIIPNQDWVLGIILILWIIFASVRTGFLKYMGQLFVSVVNFNAATRLFRQQGYKIMYGAVRLDFIFHLIVPLSVYQIADFFKISIPGYHNVVLFLALLLIINGYFFLKILLYRLAGSIVLLKDQTEESIFNIRLYYKVLGLILLPVVTVHAIHAETNFITIWIMAGFITIMYTATVFRSFYLGHRKDISIFYLILYLCTLEILPLLLIYKLVIAS